MNYSGLFNWICRICSSSARRTVLTFFSSSPPSHAHLLLNLKGSVEKAKRREYDENLHFTSNFPSALTHPWWTSGGFPKGCRTFSWPSPQSWCHPWLAPMPLFGPRRQHLSPCTNWCKLMDIVKHYETWQTQANHRNDHGDKYLHDHLETTDRLPTPLTSSSTESRRPSLRAKKSTWL